MEMRERERMNKIHDNGSSGRDCTHSSSISTNDWMF
uniref:Uncharacterized protein n=1 Tax=Arundo donax TaxID=35708 RepID=A0A0A8Y6J3_ARUDO